MATMADARTKQKTEKEYFAEVVSIFNDPCEKSLVIRASQYLAAADYLAVSGTEEEFSNKTKAWYSVLKNMASANSKFHKVSGDSIMIEVAIYRKTRYDSVFFTQEQDLGPETLAELKIAIDDWLTLDLENDIRPLLKKLYYHDIIVRKANSAALLQAYMFSHRLERGFETWTMEHMITLRHKISQLVQKKAGLGKRDRSSVELPTAKRQRVAGGDVAVAELSKVAESPQEGNSASAPSSSSSLEQNILATFPNASKVEENYHSSKATYQQTEKTLQEAIQQSSAAQNTFPDAAYSVIDKANAHLQVMYGHAEDGWTLALAQESLRSFAAIGREFEKCFEGYIKPLEMEQQAREDYDVAGAQFVKCAKKRAVVEQAMKAIQALEDL